MTPDNEPELFKSWDKIWIDKCYTSPKRYDVPWGASEWIGLNLLSVSPNLAIVDKKQDIIKRGYRDYNLVYETIRKLFI